MQKTAGSPAQSFLPGKKKIGKENLNFLREKYPAGHTCITQKQFFTTIHLLV